MFEDMEGRRVGWTELTPEIAVSTVFLGLDHSFGNGPPILFETMIIGLSADGHWDHQHRYATWDEAAERAHRRAAAARDRAFDALMAGYDHRREPA